MDGPSARESANQLFKECYHGDIFNEVVAAFGDVKRLYPSLTATYNFYMDTRDELLLLLDDDVSSVVPLTGHHIRTWIYNTSQGIEGALSRLRRVDRLQLKNKENINPNKRAAFLKYYQVLLVFISVFRNISKLQSRE